MRSKALLVLWVLFYGSSAPGRSGLTLIPAINLSTRESLKQLPKPYRAWIKEHESFTRRFGELKGKESCVPSSAWKGAGTEVEWVVALRCIEFQAKSPYPMLGVLKRGSRTLATFDFAARENYERFWKRTNAPQIELVARKKNRLQIRVLTPPYADEATAHFTLEWAGDSFRSVSVAGN